MHALLLIRASSPVWCARVKKALLVRSLPWHLYGTPRRTTILSQGADVLALAPRNLYNGRNPERRCLMESNERALNGQVALVTGASSGLGRATTLALAQAGADVALLARSADDLQQVITELTASGRRAVAFAGDLAHEDYITNAVARAIETFGRIDILVNAAGIDAPGAVVQLATSEWDYVLDVNLRAPFLLAKAVFPHMSQARRGTIINISSVAGKRGC